VRVPGAGDEAVRDLVRAREDAVRECRNARHRLKALLLRNGITYAGKTAWTAAHRRWLATLKLEHPAQQIGFQEYLHSVTEATARIARLDQALRDVLSEWGLKPLVQALQALRGVQLIAAMTLVAELQDFLRFDNPRQLMGYVGLVPSEHSSGPKRRQGSIT
jgi:transposase